MTTKETFQKDKPLCEWWSAIALSYDFARVIGFARAEMLESNQLNADEMHGINKFASVLVSLIETQEPETATIGTGLNLNLDVPRRKTP